ncbi:MAG: hypothetical protein RR837_11205, partial [Bacteroidales bacterium]
MNSKSFYFKSLLLLPAFALFASCDKENSNDGIDSGTNPNQPTEGIYPNGSIVWKKDTTVILKDHFLVEAGKSLYIEEGATIIASNVDVKPEIIVLGNMYCMGTAEKPILFTVDEASKSDRF